MEFHLKAFLKRVRMTQYDIAERLGCNQSLVATWNRGKFPTYEKICTLIENGITAKELFGDELGQKLLSNGSDNTGATEDIMSPKFKKGVEMVIAELKEKGRI